MEFSNMSRLVCMTLHAPGSNKHEHWLATQGTDTTEAYNKMIREQAKTATTLR